MFLLKIIFQNSVSMCIKNICPLSILLLVSISVTHYRCDVVGAWHITWFALARMIWHSKNFLPHFARPIFFFRASTLYNKLPVPPNANGNEEEYAERTNIFYTRRNTVLEYYFQQKHRYSILYLLHFECVSKYECSISKVGQNGGEIQHSFS